MGVVLYKDNKYVGTLEDFRKFLAKKLRYACETREKFKGIDFALVDLGTQDFTVKIENGENNIIEGAYHNALNWYGVQELVALFDNQSDERQFVSNLYGGGYFDCVNFYADDIEGIDFYKEAGELLRNKDINSADLIIWEVKQSA